MKVCFGYPEVLQVSGVALLLHGSSVTGWVFCALSLLGVAMRFGLKTQEQEKKKQEMEKLFSDLATAGKNAVSLISAAASSERDSIH